MINKVILIGNLGKDPEMRYLEGNVAVAKFPVATNENYKDKAGEWQTNTEWHDVVAWRGNAERAEKQLHKGSLVYVEGKLSHRKYQDKDGNDRYVTEVVANVLRPLDRKDSRAEGGFDSSSADVSSAASGSGATSSSSMGEEDDLPF